MTNNIKTDAELKSDVSRELACDVKIDGTAIGVAAHHGVVTLTGTVDCWADKHAAEQAAYRVAGVHEIANDIAIKPTWSTFHSDAEIAEAIQAVLACEPALKRHLLRVTVADQGSVTLMGTIDTLAARDDAAHAVGMVQGVRCVTNELVLSAPAVPIGELQGAIRQALSRHLVREAHRIEVSIDGDVVLLSGSVESWQARRAAIGVVRGIPGVKRVEDHLRLTEQIPARHTGYSR